MSSAHPIRTRQCSPKRALVLVAGLLLACGDDGDSGVSPGDPDQITTLQSAKKRLDAQVPVADIQSLTRDNTTFALDLYQSLRSASDGNLFYSPHSISLALAMTLAGAKGETATQMTDVLRFSLPTARLHPAFNALDQELARRGRDLPENGDGTGFELSITNSIWGQQDYDFELAFLDLLAQQYGAGLRLVDFAGSATESRLLINDWVEQQTRERIKDLLPEGSVNGLTRLVLTNAIYFKASWLNAFDPASTAEGNFHTIHGDTQTKPMMRQLIRTLYGEGEGWQAVDLPYVGNEVSMLVILPDLGHFRDYEAKLDARHLEQVTQSLGDARVDLTLPRFEFEATTDLSDLLQGLGLQLAFQAPGSDSGADFSRMNGRRDLFIHDVLHKAFVAVDEEGTEAAAATAVIVGVESAPMPATMTVDRPFLFLIRDRATGAILFLGRVMAPGD